MSSKDFRKWDAFGDLGRDEWGGHEVTDPVFSCTFTLPLSTRQGAGTMMYASGDIYEGSWANDNKHGPGTYFYINKVGKFSITALAYLYCMYCRTATTFGGRHIVISHPSLPPSGQAF